MLVGPDRNANCCYQECQPLGGNGVVLSFQFSVFSCCSLAERELTEFLGYQGVSVIVAAMSRSNRGTPPPGNISQVARYGKSTTIESRDLKPTALWPPSTLVHPPGVK